MTTFLLVRHATCKQMDERLNGRTEDAPLVESGWTEARALARRLAGYPVSKIFCSPRVRARQTAEIIAEPHGVYAETCAELDEVDFGTWSGQSFAALASDSRWRDWNRDREHARAPDGESMQEVQRRALRLLSTLAQDSGDACVVLVSHAEVIRSALLYMENLSLDRYGEIPLAPASVSTVILPGPTP
jgi:broad specificity phosphatase PhoE